MGSSAQWLLLISITCIGSIVAKKCLKDDKLREYPINVYYCDDPSKPECCQRNDQFTCCETDSTRNLKHQLQLWGSVAGIALVIIIVFFCFWKDSYVCEGDSIKKRLQNCCSKCCSNEEMDDETKLQDKEVEISRIDKLHAEELSRTYQLDDDDEDKYTMRGDLHSASCSKTNPVFENDDSGCDSATPSNVASTNPSPKISMVSG